MGWDELDRPGGLGLGELSTRRGRKRGGEEMGGGEG